MAARKKAVSRKHKPLSIDRILHAALALADKDGIEALSMRTLAAKLNVEAMSLYKHVANKEAVFDGLADLVIAEIELPPEQTPWREAMHSRAISARRVIFKHPWIAPIFESRRNPSTVRMAYANAVLGFLRRGGLSVEQSYRAFVLLDSFIFGFVTQELNWVQTAHERKMIIAAVHDFIPAGSHPHLVEIMAHVAKMPTNPTGDSDYDAEFFFGLNLLLDAIEKTAARDRS
ncbi:MAG: TetR/AcrR family transcriptional regulator C-terminal domain-containing protein [Turneriella sp.]|nr:TetR/AcrR family transcriptional regulator C-terminal domain-containing protein [Turneriella sp.]